MASNKNSLSSKTPVKSSLNDIDIDNRGFEFEFEVESGDAVEKHEKKLDVSIGWHKVVATGYRKVLEVTTHENSFGDVFTEDPHWEVALEDIATHESDVLKFPLTPKGERSFKNAINRRSNKDLARKCAPKHVTELTVESIIRVYMTKCPINFLYDYSEWVDEQTGDWKRSKNPKWHLWVPEDFQPQTPSNWIKLR